MNQLPQQPRLTQFAISSWLRKIRAGTQRNQTNVGGDITAIETPYGVTYKSKKPLGYNMFWSGNFNENEGYGLGEVVEVTVDKVYYGVDSEGNPKTYESSRGIYVCTSPVPPVFTTTGFDYYPEYMSTYLVGENKRIDGVVYAPVYPHPTSTPFAVEQSYQDKFWNLIASGGMTFVGEWSSVRLYNPQEVVVIRSGTNEGTYINILPLSGSQTGSLYSPDIGSPYWVQLAGSAKGVWN